MIFVIKLRLLEGRHSPAIIWLCSCFSSNFFGEISQIFTICENFPADHLKAEKKGVTKAVSLLFAILYLLPLFQIWSCEFFYQQAQGETQICLTVQQILRNFTAGKAINLTRKILISFVAKHYVME